MTPEQRNELDSLLFDQGHKLVNIKFFPGPKPGLTSSEFCQEAAAVLKEVGTRDPGPPPSTGREKATIEEFLS